MKHSLILCALIAFTFSSVSAQIEETRGTMSLTEGRSYFVAFPQVWDQPMEKPLNPAQMLFVSSRVKAKVRIQTPAAINNAARLDREYTLEPNKVLQIPISTAYMNKVSESREGYGILVTSDKPITVFTFQAWFGNGELARHIPTEAWGTEYYSMNFYQDRFSDERGNLRFRPSQILVVASEDNTIVTYSPTVDTEGGSDAPSVRKGTIQGVILERGETYLIKDKIDTANVKEFYTDLTGTFISSSKPIGVISGCTKVAIMRMPDLLPPTGMYQKEAHFVRSNPHEVMLPLEMAGTKFVTVPCMYTPTRQTGQIPSNQGIDDDRGDVIRVVALEDSTTIKAMRMDGSGLLKVWMINRGETRLQTSQEVACYWESDKPILMAQYGKSYAKILPPETDKRTDETQAGPWTESGMPMLEVIPSVDRWSSHGAFKSPEGMDNFFNIVFEPKDAGKIKIDSKALNSAFGGSMRILAGTPYATIRTAIGAGDHVVESENDNIKWCAWTYGSLDGLQQGRAYGSPVSIDLSIPSNDSIVVVSQMEFCGDVTGHTNTTSTKDTLHRLFSVYADVLDNYELRWSRKSATSADWSLYIIDSTRNASATVRVVSRSGKFVTRSFSHTAELFALQERFVNWGLIDINTPVTRQFTLSNASNTNPLTVSSLRAKHFPDVYTFEPKTFTIPPGASQKVNVTATIAEQGEVIDTVIAQLGCTEWQTVQLVARVPAPVIYVGDQTWVRVPCDAYGFRKEVMITNGSSPDLTITGYDETKLPITDDGIAHFFAPKNLKEKLPITLRRNTSHTFTVMYSPRGDKSGPHTVDVAFFSNAQGVDSIATLIGSCDSTVSSVQDVDATSPAISPMPVVLSRDAFVSVSIPHTARSLRIFDALGREIFSRDVDNEKMFVATELFHAAGLYSIRFEGASFNAILPLICID